MDNRTFFATRKMTKTPNREFRGRIVKFGSPSSRTIGTLRWELACPRKTIYRDLSVKVIEEVDGSGTPVYSI